MPGILFTSYFLEEGILHTAAWQDSLSQLADLDSFRTQALALLQKADNFHAMNEASTEMELIRPLFKLLGWADFLPQQGSDHNEDIPDHLLFGDAESKDNAVNKPPPRATPTPLPLPKASDSIGPSTPAKENRPVHRTPSSSATWPPPTSTPTGASAGVSSPTAASGVSTTAAPSMVGPNR